MTSRVGKLPIKVADDIKVEIDGNVVTLKKGNKTKTYDFGNKVDVLFEDKSLIVKEKKDSGFLQDTACLKTKRQI